MNDLGNLLQMILDLLKSWAGSFSDYATAVMEKLNLIEEDTDNLSDIKSNTDDIKDNTGAIITPVQSIQSTNSTIASDTTSIKNTVSGMSNQLTTIATNVGTASAFAEDCANNTLNIQDKVTTIASDTTQIRSNTNTVVTDLDKVYEALKWALVNIETTETVEDEDSVSFDTDMTEDLVSLEVGIMGTQSGTGNPTPTNMRPITDYSNDSLNANGNVITISFGSTIFEGVLDIINGRLTILKKSFKISDKTWLYDSTYRFFNTQIPDIKTPDNASVLNGLIAECYTTRTAGQAGSGDVNYSIAGSISSISTKFIRIKDNDYSTPSDFVSNMGNIKIVYPLEIPEIVNLTPSQIATIKGINTISTDTNGNVEVTYKESVKHYLDKQE